MKTLLDIVRQSAGREEPVPEKVPWDDPEFSERMLREHLRQDHDSASRRTGTIEEQVRWIDERLESKPRSVLDLGCGPGFYTTLLAQLGHSCTGMDISPASIRYAKELVSDANLECEHRLDDVRTAEFGGPYDLVMMLSGEFGTFNRDEATRIVRKAYDSLEEGGRLLIEVHTMEAVRRLGRRMQMWYAREGGPFSDNPHIVLLEQSWDDGERKATTVYHVIDAETSEVWRYGERMFGYGDDEYLQMLRDCGFTEATIDWSFPAAESDTRNELMAIVGTKRTIS